MANGVEPPNVPSAPSGHGAHQSPSIRQPGCRFDGFIKVIAPLFDTLAGNLGTVARFPLVH
jgi:hypothetical protein